MKSPTDTEHPLFSYERPETIDQLRAIILLARERGRKVRVVGAQHSIEDAIYGLRSESERCTIVSMAAFDRIELVRDARRIEGEKSQIRVEAGVHFAEAPYVQPGPTRAARLDLWLRDHGLDLIHVGGIVQQTVVGFLATGSSGGSWTHSLYDRVVAVQLVDGHGQEHTIARGDPRFPAAGVSLGLLGVVVSMTLEVEDHFDVQGEETFERLPPGADALGPTVRGFLAGHEYARMIWWPQNRTAQFWRAHRVEPRPDVRYNPYLPTGVETLGRQVLTSLLYVVIGNVTTLKTLRAASTKLRQARIPDYLDYLSHQERYRPLSEQDTEIEVLDNDPFYHWSLSRFRRPRVVRADLSRFVRLGEKGLVELALLLLGTIPSDLDDEPGALEALRRFLKRLLLAGADELLRRLLLQAMGDVPRDDGEVRRRLDGLGDVVTALALGGLHVGPIGAGVPAWEELEAWWHGRVEMPDGSVGEIADHLGQVAATLLVPLGQAEQALAGSPEGELWAELLHRGCRLGIHATVPQVLDTFFEDYLYTPPPRMGFNDTALDGIAMDRRINHNLVQTKFSELWIPRARADEALAILHRYLDEAVDDKGLEGALGLLRGPLEELDDQKGSEGVPASVIVAVLTKLLDLLAPPYEERFRRQTAYSIELYGGRADDRFLLYPGASSPGEDWLRVNFFWFAFKDGSVEKHYEQFWELLTEAGVPFRVHWGKYLPREGPAPWDAPFAQRIADFLELRTTFDPDGLFYTDYWRDVLERRVDADEGDGAAP